MDVGATHSRARIVEKSVNILSRSNIISSRDKEISNKNAFLEFLSDFINDSGQAEKICMAIFCLAGPIIDQKSAMTNWQEPRDINLEDVIKIGLPKDNTILVNDMEGAAYGLIAYKSADLPAEVIEMYAGSIANRKQNNNAVLIMPGTGVGVAGIVASATDQKALDHHAVSCELQHTAISPFDEQHAKIIELIKSILNKKRPSWEDFVSGRGLENIHICLNRLTNVDTICKEELNTAEIAKRAVEGTDQLCRQALDLYYRCAGGLAQIVALSFQPYGGIYLAGTTTNKNLAFISSSHYLTELQNNELRRELLLSFPVYLVPGNLSLDGAAHLASLRLKRNDN